MLRYIQGIRFLTPWRRFSSPHAQNFSNQRGAKKPTAVIHEPVPSSESDHQNPEDGATIETVDNSQLYPSEGFLRKIQRRRLFDRLSILIAEVEVIKELTHEVPSRLTDAQWDMLLAIRRADERHEFLRSAYYSEISREKTSQANAEANHTKSAVLADKQVRYDAGEMVYGRGFYDFIDLRGSEFRRQVDNYHGAQLIARERVADPMPQLIVDCRYLQKNSERHTNNFVKQVKTLYDYNWFHPDPYRITITNLFMDQYVARLVKMYWHFAFGNAVRNETDDDAPSDDFDLAEFEDFEDLFPVAGPGKQVFAPRITSRSIRDALDPGIRNEEVAVIGRSASRFLPDDLSRFKAFVLSTSLDEANSFHTSSIAASDDGFTSYRLPIEKYVSWTRGSKNLSFARTAAILKEVLQGRSTWSDAIKGNVPAWHLVPYSEPRPIPHEVEVNRKAKEEKMLVVKKALSEILVNKVRISEVEAQTRGPNRRQKPAGEQGPRPKRQHRYSREERNRRRKEEQGE